MLLPQQGNQGMGAENPTGLPIANLVPRRCLVTLS
jgi:hypothetical protein